MRYWNNLEFRGRDIVTSVKTNLELCIEECVSNSECQAFTYDHQNQYAYVNCWLKSMESNNIQWIDEHGYTSGMRCSHVKPSDLNKEPDGQYPCKSFYFYEITGFLLISNKFSVGMTKFGSSRS